MTMHCKYNPYIVVCVQSNHIQCIVYIVLPTLFIGLPHFVLLLFIYYAMHIAIYIYRSFLFCAMYIPFFFFFFGLFMTCI